MCDKLWMTAWLCALPLAVMAADAPNAQAHQAAVASSSKHPAKPVAHAHPAAGKTVAAKAPAKPVYVYKYAGDLPPLTAPKAVASPALAPALAAMPAQSDGLVAVAQQVHTGHMACELGNSVSVTPDEQNPGHFFVKMKHHTYRMAPVVSATGAIRLEDAQAGAMWLQLSNKSMLMNSKLGQRMADECQSPDQAVVARAMKLNPPPHLLDGPTVAKK